MRVSPFLIKPLYNMVHFLKNKILNDYTCKKHFIIDICIPSKVACQNFIAQCQNVEINCRNCRNSDWSIISTYQNLSKLTKITTKNRREMNYSLLERSRRAESNGGEIIFLRAFYGKILSKITKHQKFSKFTLRYCAF